MAATLGIEVVMTNALPRRLKAQSQRFAVVDVPYPKALVL
jgi:hypothetical protein